MGKLQKILIVDDRIENLVAMRRVLSDLKLEIELVEASSGNEALLATLDHNFALAVLDVQMPEMDGYELATILRNEAKTKDVPIIFVSAVHTDEFNVFWGYDVGAVDFISKPLDPLIFLSKVKVFLKLNLQMREIANHRDELEKLVEQRTETLRDEITKRKQTEEAIARLNSILRASRNVDQLIVQEKNRHKLLMKVCQLLVETEGFHSVWIVLIDPQFLVNNTELTGFQCIEPFYHAEVEEYVPPFVEKLHKKQIPESARLVLKTGGVHFAAEDDGDCADVRLKMIARLEHNERIFGCLAIAIASEYVQSAEERDLLAEIASDLSFALHAIDINTALCESEERKELALLGANLGTWDWQVKTGVVTFNERWAEMLGYELSEIKPSVSMWEELVHAEDMLKVQPILNAHLKGHTNSYEAEHRMKHKLGHWIWVLDMGRVIERDAGGKAQRVCGTHLDITERKHVEAEQRKRLQAEAENLAKSRFLASMSHEIRTPMNAVLGYTQILLRESGLTAQQKDYLEIIDRSGDHLLSVIDEVLDLARAESGEVSLILSDVELPVLLLEIKRMFDLQASEKAIELTLTFSETVPLTLCTDAVKIRQVMINVLGNALKFTDEGSISIQVSSVELDEKNVHVTIEVTDTGCGVKSNEIEPIFVPFVQTEAGSLKAGTGLGLAVSRELARQLGGELSATSELGVGSVFSFEFQAERIGPLTRSPSERQILKLAPGTRPPNVLVVDDQMMLTQMLSKAGLAVTTASSGQEALTAFAAQRPELLLLDMQLPGMDGLEVIRRIGTLTGGAEVPVVIVSASALHIVKTNALNAGADGFLRKPLREEQLFLMLRRHIDVEFQIHSVSKASDSQD
jgi:PAS domain S-box-containing protein